MKGKEKKKVGEFREKKEVFCHEVVLFLFFRNIHQHSYSKYIHTAFDHSHAKEGTNKRQQINAFTQKCTLHDECIEKLANDRFSAVFCGILALILLVWELVGQNKFIMDVKYIGRC